MSDGFLGRWSRRKLDAVQGKPLPPEPPGAAPEVQERAADVPAPQAGAGTPAATVTDANGPPLAAQAPAPRPPTLEDVQALGADSDFSRFAAHDVAPEVRNAAMKKLFADPRYNVMDGMDVYIDDYSKPDPIPAHMLRQLAAAATLKLFEEAPAPAVAPGQAPAQPRDVADDPTGQTVAQSASECAAVPEPTDHDDPDLRLQQDDAAPGGQPGGDAA